MNTILYLDTISPELEQVMIDSCPEHLSLKFLNPTVGTKGNLVEADYLLVSGYQVTADTIDQAPNLKMIQRTGVGYERVDVEHAASRNIPVCLVGEANSDSVAELIVMHILALYRKLIILDSATRRKEWHPMTYKCCSYEIKGKTLGIVGAGRIGRALARKLSGFCLNGVIYHNRHRLADEQERELGMRYCELDELMKTADIISVNTPLTNQSANLINKSLIDSMKPNAILINTSRGPTIDNFALADALRNNKILGAGLDVFIKEPITPEDPLIGLDNVVLTPHIGAATIDCYRTSCMSSMENISRMHAGEQPLWIVN
ncbi:dehydrogenase [Synergistales bacterium]|nr:dehydrogenase [Synergistales bacterium]